MQTFRQRLRPLKYLVLGTIPIGPRAILLHKLAYKEENLRLPTDREAKLSDIMIFPRSFIEKIQQISHHKVFDYSFLGTLFFLDVYKNRKWIIDFAQRRFTTNSYYCITDAPPGYQVIGSYDHSLDNCDHLIPKFASGPELGFFDEAYFQILCQSRFTLCPAGDAPWSMRFFESIMCHSIPILDLPSHAGRNHIERNIGYKFYLKSEQHEYREDWAKDNYSKFIKWQTLIHSSQSDEACE